MAAEALLEEGFQPHRLDHLFHPGASKGAHILRGGALRLVLDHGLLEDERMRRVGDHQPLDARRVGQRRQPGYCPAPVVAEEREALDPERLSERHKDRKSGGEGKSVSERVALCGRRYIKKKKNKT